MKQEKYLHLVAFNVPYPPNYGGIIDIYYKLKALSSSGVKVILHIFSYGRPAVSELDEHAHSVHYYKRNKNILQLFSTLPFIVSGRSSGKLKKKLLADDHPVLFEGLHTTRYLEDCKKAGKKVLVRTHNIEHNYYSMLAESSRNLFKRIYLRIDARKLKRYEAILAQADNLFSISTTDTAYFNELYHNSIYVSAFHQSTEVASLPGRGKYILFHGNLSVPENEKAVLFLIKNVLSNLSHKVIVAGKDPGRILMRRCELYDHIELISNPDNESMNQLVRDAHINLLYTYQPTGLKLKLLHSLHSGRFCMANPLMISGSGLDDLCVLYRTPSEAVEKIEVLMNTEFDEHTLDVRTSVLSNYNNHVNAAKIVELL